MHTHAHIDARLTIDGDTLIHTRTHAHLARYSGQVFNDESRSNAILVAFDDGDLQAWTHEEMAAELTANALQVPYP